MDDVPRITVMEDGCVCCPIHKPVLYSDKFKMDFVIESIQDENLLLKTKIKILEQKLSELHGSLVQFKDINTVNMIRNS